MPASLTRLCPVCTENKATPSDFREVGETGPGRPPRVCRSCRHAIPALQVAYLAGRSNLDADRAYHRRNAERAEYAMAHAIAIRYPDGRKTCPPVAGCGLPRGLDAFGVNRHQADGLTPLCVECMAEHAALRDHRYSS